MAVPVQSVPAIEPVSAQRAIGADAGQFGHVREPTRSVRAQQRAGLVRRALLGADAIGLSIAYVAGQLASGAGRLSPDAELLVFAATIPLWIVAAKLFGLYTADELRIDHSTFDETIAVLLLATVGSWLFFGIAQLWHRLPETGGKLLVFWLVATPSVMLGRSAARALFRRSPGFRQRALIVGADETGRSIGRKLGRHPEYGVDLVGFVDDPGSDLGDGDGLVGAPEQLREIVRERGIDRVVFAFSQRTPAQTLALIRSLSDLDVYVDLVPRFFGIVGPSGRIHSVEGLPLIGLPPVRLSRSSRLVKRAIDVAGALVGLVVTAPLFVVLSFMIRRDSPGPALFRQTRLGERMREFTMLKFRTMRVGTDETVHRDFIGALMDAAAKPQANGLYKLERDDAVTRIGAFLRRTSLDELPQLLNILRGDMSLVGPRPCIAYETEFFKPHHFERFLVPAGLTGLWQVTARAHSTFGEALDLDVAYARGWSIGLDLTLVLRTIRQVLTRKGTA